MTCSIYFGIMVGTYQTSRRKCVLCFLIRAWQRQCNTDELIPPDIEGIGSRRAAEFLYGRPDPDTQADAVGFVRRLLAECELGAGASSFPR